MAKIEIASFDIFDTLLSRTTLIPTDIFYLIGAKLFAKGLLQQHQIEDFVTCRVKSEDQSRWGRMETDLESIWKELTKAMKLPDSYDYVSLELSTERENIYVIESARKNLDFVRSLGIRIIFISDTYLPHQFIKDLLGDYELYREGDGLYVSSAYGKTKVSGLLYDLVLDREGVKPGSIKHHGDNKFSDIIQARKKGFLTKHIPFENNAFERRLLRRLRPADIYQRNLVASCRYLRLNSQVYDGAVQLTSTFIAPVCSIFLNWIAQQSSVMLSTYCFLPGGIVR